MVNETLVSLDKSINYFELIFSKLITKFVVAAIILLLGFVIGRIAGKVLEKILHEIELDNIAKKTINLKASLEQIIGKSTSGFIYFIAIVMALSQFGLETTILNIVAAAIIVFILISVILAIKDVVPNIFAGLILQPKRLIKLGDYVQIGNISGKITHFSLSEIRLETDSGDMISIPNSALLKSQLTKINKQNKIVDNVLQQH